MDSRDAYEEKAKARLDGLQADIEKLKARAREANADARINLEAEVADLEARQEAVRTKLAQLRAAGGEALEEVKEGIDAAVADLRNAFDKASAKLKG